MSSYSRFFTFFQNVIVGSEGGNEESSFEKALSTIESASTMESINLVISDEISNYENEMTELIDEFMYASLSICVSPPFEVCV